MQGTSIWPWAGFDAGHDINEALHIAAFLRIAQERKAGGLFAA